jgi:hypothetical protein
MSFDPAESSSRSDVTVVASMKARMFYKLAIADSVLITAIVLGIAKIIPTVLTMALCPVIAVVDFWIVRSTIQKFPESTSEEVIRPVRWAGFAFSFGCLFLMVPLWFILTGPAA